MKDRIILHVAAKFLIPFVLLFAFYVQWHGEYSPGGGFQAGVISAAVFILYGIIFGLNNLRKVITERILIVMSALGVLIYGSVGVTTMLLGGKFLDYNFLNVQPHIGQQIGIVTVEIGVGITVFAVMVLIFTLFAGRKD